MTPRRHKISVIGAGNVGATLAQRIFESGTADVVLLDIAANMACGKAIDLLDAAPLVGSEAAITGTGDYTAIAGSEIVVVTAGLARKPGMTREDLVAKNAAIVRDVSFHIRTHAPDAIVIIVTNPLDTMTYLALKTTGFPRSRVFGMAGALDSARFIAIVASELGVKRSEIETYILGSHGDTMVPLLSATKVRGKPIENLMTKDDLERAVQRTRDRGAEVVKLLGTGSAYYSPSAAVMKMILAILNDTHETIATAACLDGEYGMSDICIGVPCRLGRSGIEAVVEVAMGPGERAAFEASARAIKSTIELL